MTAKDKTVGIFIEDNYQELEFWYPYLRLQEEGMQPLVIGTEKRTFKSKLGYEIKADVDALEVVDKAFDAIIIPGGYAPDKMRVHQPMLNIVKATHKASGIIAAICHAGWVLVSAGVLSDVKATCYHTIKDDLINAGAHYLDEAVVVDKNIITSRQPNDLPVFCQEIISHLTHGS